MNKKHFILASALLMANIQDLNDNRCMAIDTLTESGIMDKFITNQKKIVVKQPSTKLNKQKDSSNIQVTSDSSSVSSITARATTISDADLMTNISNSKFEDFVDEIQSGNLDDDGFLLTYNHD
jgi:hypothetical protein